MNHLYHYAKRVTCTLVRHPPKPVVVKESLLFDMAKKKAMEEEQERLVRDMMERIEYIPLPEKYHFDCIGCRLSS